MLRRPRFLAALCLVFLVSGCGDKKSPTGPSQPPAATPTRIIRLEGNMAFGNIEIGQFFEAVLRIYNDGNAPLTVSGMTGPGGYTATWTNGTIAAGTSQASTIRFTPTAAQTYNGTLTVNGDQTSGSNTLPISGTGVRPPRPQFTKTGSGDSVFDMPTDVARVRIIGTYSGRSQNFIVRIAGRTIVNEIIGTDTPFTIGPRYQGDHLLSTGGVVEVRNSSGVVWSFEELR